MITTSTETQYFRAYRTGAWHACANMDSVWVQAECGQREHMIDTEWAYEPPRNERVCEECKARVSEERRQAA